MGFDSVELSDVLTEKGYIRGPFGSALKRGEMKDSGIPVYEQNHAIYGEREFRYFIDQEKFEDLNRFQVQEDDLIISCSGTVGEISIIDKSDPKGIISQALLILRVDTERMLPHFLRYFFTSRTGRYLLLGASHGSVQNNIAKKSIVTSIPIPLPSLEIQNEIVDQLYTIDQKIHLNEQTNETLEKIAQAIFKSWFVDFDPVHAKIEAASAGRDPNRAAMAAIAGVSFDQDWDAIDTALQQKLDRMSEDQCTQLRQTAELFPDELVESEIGEVPKGWKVKKLGKVSELNPETIPTDYEGEIEYINISGVNEGVINETELYDFTDAPSRARRKVKSGDVIWSNVRPNLKAYSLIVKPNSNTIASTGFTVIRPKLLSASFLYNYSTTENFISYLINSTEGSAYPAVKVSDFKRHKIIVPPQKIDEVFHELVWDIFEKIDANRKQNFTLSELRDTLLPKLISGEVGV